MKIPREAQDAIEAALISGQATEGPKTLTLADQSPLEDISEKEFMWQVINFATDHHWVYYHTYRSDRSEKGFPDLVLVRGCILYREIKTETGKVTKDQSAWIAYLSAAGGDAKVWRPSNWHEIQEVLK